LTIAKASEPMMSSDGVSTVVDGGISTSISGGESMVTSDKGIDNRARYLITPEAR
jgi:hypothetical protein